MSLGRPEWPEVGELVVATVIKIESYGAYVKLDEYGNKEGLLHISEISSRWVRNIRNHVRQGQKVVLQVLRTDSSKGQVDLSLRRLSKDDQRKKIESWKKNRKAETLLATVANQLETDFHTLYDEEIVKLVEHYGSLYEGLEESAKRGVEALTEAGLSDKTAKIVWEVAHDKIIIKGVTIQGVFEMTSMGNRGVEEIKETLLNTNDVAMQNDATAEISAIGAPKYRIKVTADDYKIAEKALTKIIDYTEESWSKRDGSVSFTRE